jgi:hypothetical protein
MWYFRDCQEGLVCPLKRSLRFAAARPARGLKLLWQVRIARGHRPIPCKSDPLGKLITALQGPAS